MPGPKKIFNWYEYKVVKGQPLTSFAVYKRFRPTDSTPYPATLEKYYYLELGTDENDFGFGVFEKTWGDDDEDRCKKNAFNIFKTPEAAKAAAEMIIEELSVSLPEGWDVVMPKIIMNEQLVKNYLMTIKSTIYA